MDTTENFGTKMNKEVLDHLRDYARSFDRPIATIVSEAVAEYLARIEVRPAFRGAVDDEARTWQKSRRYSRYREPSLACSANLVR